MSTPWQEANLLNIWKMLGLLQLLNLDLLGSITGMSKHLCGETGECPKDLMTTMKKYNGQENMLLCGIIESRSREEFQKNLEISL
jgi:hypothetical protein